MKGKEVKRSKERYFELGNVPKPCKIFTVLYNCSF